MSDGSGELQGLLNWVLGGVAALFMALSKIIHGFLANERTTNATRIKALEDNVVATTAKHEAELAASNKKHEDCERDRYQLGMQCARLEARLDSLENKLKPEGQ